ncbi:creatininase family protein [Zobellia galactanivorans]|uniref:creatininase family protein n=1 Tax=Zobellia galactanivorans (strain DSM 12802 / CCUG 47099 / CIP 106680 / NCIMB 13871 / Dsij) TaxID=63186 RepID=UPI001C070EE5|nr:creatininase family protein [Zobellia galactanivorans]MBU3025267.1 creatininase family protein [Zobellia galactanivorans]
MVKKDYGQFQIEQLNPIQIEAALKKRSLIYLPLGAMEWHGMHLPIGLDSLTSHGVCLRAAEKTGGLVMPPLYYGMTGSIWHHPYTILIEEEEVLLQILMTTLQRLETDNIEKVVIFTGHFALKQLEMLARLEERWNAQKRVLDVIVMSISECPNVTMKADHGAIFETSILAQIKPGLVRLENLPDKDVEPANDPEGNSMGDHRRDRNNVLFGVFGDDPRFYDKDEAETLFDTIVEWVAEIVE